MSICVSLFSFLFQSSRSLRTATGVEQKAQTEQKQFQSSRSLRTATQNQQRRRCHSWQFQSSRSLRTATRDFQLLMKRIRKFQSSRSLRTATVRASAPTGALPISILAVLADRDFVCKAIKIIIRYFNPRGPCGPRPGSSFFPVGVMTFQSSRSLRTATLLPPPEIAVPPGISILAVLADRDVISTITGFFIFDFNPRGPCGPRRRPGRRCTSSSWNFNPRGPCGPRQQRRTKDLPRLCTKRRIFSPHQKVFCGKDGKTNVFPPLPRAFSGANLPGSVRALGPRTRSSGSLPAGRSACSQSARSCSRISFPGSKNADYPAPDP